MDQISSVREILICLVKAGASRHVIATSAVALHRTLVACSSVRAHDASNNIVVSETDMNHRHDVEDWANWTQEVPKYSVVLPPPPCVPPPVPKKAHSVCSWCGVWQPMRDRSDATLRTHSIDITDPLSIADPWAGQQLKRKQNAIGITTSKRLWAKFQPTSRASSSGDTSSISDMLDPWVLLDGMCNCSLGAKSARDKLELNSLNDGDTELNFVGEPRRRACQEEQHAEALETRPTCSPENCVIKRIFADVKIYTADGITYRTLDEEAYKYHFNRGELDVAPAWKGTFVKGFCSDVEL